MSVLKDFYEENCNTDTVRIDRIVMWNGLVGIANYLSEDLWEVSFQNSKSGEFSTNELEWCFQD